MVIVKKIVAFGTNCLITLPSQIKVCICMADKKLRFQNKRL